MKCILVPVLVASLAANLLALSRALQSDAEGMPAGGTGQPLIVPGDRNREPAASTKAATLIALERAALAKAATIASRYWVAGASYELDYARAVQAANESLRRELIERYGQSAQTDPLFRRVFRPLDPLYAFLSPEQQAALQRLKLERDRRLQAQREPGLQPVRASSRDAGGTAAAVRAYRSELGRVLDAAALFELGLRDSPTARQLRGSGVELTEAEFRESYRALAPLEEPGADLDAVIAARATLRRLLGDRRFAQLWAARDPLFARLEQVGDKHGLSESALTSVYVLLNDFHDERLQAARLARLDPGRLAETLAAIDREEAGRLALLVGDTVAAEMLTGRAIASADLLQGAERARR